MSGLEEDFTKKAGPLPVWAWGIVGAGGILLFQHLRKPQAVATTADSGTVADPGAIDGGLTPAYDASFGSVLAQSGYGSAGGQSIPVPLSATQLQTLIHDELLGLGFTPEEIASGVAQPVTPVADPTPAVQPTTVQTAPAPVYSYPTPQNLAPAGLVQPTMGPGSGRLANGAPDLSGANGPVPAWLAAYDTRTPIAWNLDAQGNSVPVYA